MINLTKDEIKNLEYVGNGNFGRVYRKGNMAYKIYKDEVKTIYGQYVTNPALNYNPIKLNQLIKTGNKLRHTDLINDKIFVEGKFKGVTYPYYDGFTLDILMYEPIQKKIGIAKQLVRNAKELTDNHIYPTDYKLKNMVLQNGQVKIIDLDDSLTKIHWIPNHICKNKSIRILDETIKTYFDEYRHYNVSSEITDKIERKLPQPNKKYEDINAYINEKSIPFNYIFVSDDTDINIVKTLLKTKLYRIIYVYYKNDTKRILSEINKYLSNGIFIYDIISAIEINEYMNLIIYDDCLGIRGSQLIKK